MSKILLIHASCDGQTEAIAERIADRVTRLGHHVTVRPFDAPQTWREAGTADAIVKYRMTNGEFRNLDDMKNVPGLDIARVEARKNQLQF